NDYKQTPLHISVEKELQTLTKEILKRTNKVNVKDADGYTPLHIAAEKMNKKIAVMLINKKASVSIKNNYGYTPIDISVALNDIKTLAVLLSKRNVINKKDEIGNTLLHKAVNNTSLKTVQYLLRKKAYVNTKNIYNATPICYIVNKDIMYNSKFKDIHLLKLLIPLGSQIHVKLENQIQLLENTLISYKEKEAILLLQAGINPNIKDSKLNTIPLEKTFLTKFRELQKLLILSTINAKLLRREPLKIPDSWQSNENIIIRYIF
ncbi:MAG: ankyrin repeat domain-containing protein, partial [Candidatus Micrarchaeia archaeon]